MQYDQSPETDLGPDRKRRRKVLSCIACRSRKVACDRGLPACGRCSKAGKAAACTYEDDVPSAFNGSGNGSVPQAGGTTRQAQAMVTVSKEVWEDVLSRLLQQESTIERMRNGRIDSMAGSHPKPYISSQPLQSYATSGDGDEAPKETILFRGKAFKTQFHGPSDAGSSLMHIPEIFIYARDVISRSPTLVRCRRELGELRKLKKRIDKDESQSASEDLLSYLPQRDRADAMVARYFDSIDTTYSVLHTPSFRRDYEALWQAPESINPGFLVTVLLMIACVESLVEEEPRLFVGDSPMPRERAANIVRACEAWILRQSQKHTTLAYFQIQCILLIAKEMNTIKLKRRWIDTGNLLRVAVAAGMHRNTDLLQKHTSDFDKEMRRRIWSAIVELDLQASVNRGMSAVSLSYNSDCGLPLNIHDEDLPEDTKGLPLSRPQAQLTKTSYLRLSGESRPLRSKLTTVLNQPHLRLTYEEVLTYTQEVEQHLTTLPCEPHNESFGATFEDSVALLRMQLEQFLLILHASAARQATTNIGAVFSKTAFISTSRSIIRRLSELSASGRRYLLLYRQEIVRIFVAIGSLGVLPTRNCSSADTTDQLKALLEIADDALSLFEDRILRTGNHQWTFSFAIYDMLRHQLSTSPAQKEGLTGRDRMCRLYKHVINNQDPDFAMKAATCEVREERERRAETPLLPTALTNTELDTQPREAMDGLGQQPRNTIGQDPMISVDALMYGGGTADLMMNWNFDDWMMYNDQIWPQNLAGAESSTS